MWHHGFAGFALIVGLGKTLGKLDLFSLQLRIIPSHNQITWYKMLWLWVTDIVNKDGWSVISWSKDKSAFKGSISDSKLWPSPPWNTSVSLCVWRTALTREWGIKPTTVVQQKYRQGSGDNKGCSWLFPQRYKGLARFFSSKRQGWGFHALGIPCRGRVYKDRQKQGWQDLGWLM